MVTSPPAAEYDTVDAMKKALKTEEHTIVGMSLDYRSNIAVYFCDIFIFLQHISYTESSFL